MPRAAPKDPLFLEDILVTFMRSNNGFHTAREIKAATGITRDDIRAMPIFAQGLIVALPDEGFCLTENVDEDTLKHVIASMRSRASEISLRADAIESHL